MNKYYILNNSNDNTLYLKDDTSDTRLISESKRFTDRRLAKNYLVNKNLTENYQVKMVTNKVRKIDESLDTKSIIEDLESALDDTKDMIDTTIEYIDAAYNSDDQLKEDLEGMYKVPDILDKLKKVKTYMSGISFTPTFDNSLSAVSDFGGNSNE